jgi:hypothetical protein
MTISYKFAENIINYYKFLIGKPFNTSIAEIEIINIVVAPNDESQLEVFLKEMQTTMSYHKALSISGYDPEHVVVLVMGSHIDYPEIRVNQDIDLYLRKNFIERVYLNPYYFEP